MEMEAERHKQMDVFIKRLLLTGIFIPLLILLFWSSFWGDYIAGSRNLTELTVYVLAGYVFISLFYCRSPIVSFKIDVKEEVMAKFAAFWGDFIYAYGRSLPDTTLENSRIFPLYDSKEGDDFFCGNYHQVQAIISEEQLYKKVRTKNGSHNVTVFQGIVILLEMNKKFEGKTVVLKDSGWLNLFKKSGGRNGLSWKTSALNASLKFFPTTKLRRAIC